MPRILTALVATMFACLAATVQAGETAAPGVADPALARIVAAYWAELEARDPSAQLQQGRVVQRIPHGTFAEARRNAKVARRFLAELGSLRREGLAEADRLSADILAWSLDFQARAERDWWYEFSVTTYTTFDLTVAGQALRANPLATVSDRAAYLTLLGSIAGRLDATHRKLRMQAAKGIALPAPAAGPARQYFEALRPVFAQIVAQTGSRTGELDPKVRDPFLSAVRRRVDGRIEAARAEVVRALARAEREGPQQVGLGQYPGGSDAYRDLVRFHTSLEMTPEQVMALGEQRMTQVNGQLDAIAVQLEIPGGRSGIRDLLRSDARFIARTPDDVAARYRKALGRIAPKIPEYFSTVPRSPYGVRRLDEAAEAGMTFGYYQEPTPGYPTGEYRFNGSRLEDRSLVFAVPIIYHELVPGHHFEIALQLENESLPAFRRLPRGFWFNAYHEGWAEYAAGLADEMGLLDDPYDRLGRLMLQAFLTSRLVVDSGMNYFGWSLERARQYMFDNTYQSKTEIDSETLRYSTAIPGQALGYKVGDQALSALRRAVESKQGSAFDIRAFHSELLSTGGMPLTVLQQHIGRRFALEPTAP